MNNVDFNDDFQEMILDLLTYPDGPRVRDRVSHGETDAFPSVLAEHVVLLAAALCIQFLEPQSSLHQVRNLINFQLNIGFYAGMCTSVQRSVCLDIIGFAYTQFNILHC